jgi:hypothetical protein
LFIILPFSYWWCLLFYLSPPDDEVFTMIFFLNIWEKKMSILQSSWHSSVLSAMTSKIWAYFPSIKLTVRYNWNIVKSGVQPHNPYSHDDTLSRFRANQSWSYSWILHTAILNNFLLQNTNLASVLSLPFSYWWCLLFYLSPPDDEVFTMIFFLNIWEKKMSILQSSWHSSVLSI